MAGAPTAGPGNNRTTLSAARPASRARAADRRRREPATPRLARHTDLQVMPEPPLVSRGMAQCAWKQQRMLVSLRRIAAFFSGSRAVLPDSILEADKVVRLAVIRHVAHEMRRIAVEPVEMRRIDGILHRLEPVAVDHRFDDRPPFPALAHSHPPARQQ